MYLLFVVLFLAALICMLINFYRKKRIIKTICCMSCQQRCCKINEIIAPFGYCYDCREGVFSSRLDAWQREFGFRAHYDKTAAAFNMVYDCEPIYFNYEGKTWLLEFWKGQYGINIGGEIGIYQANMQVPVEEREHVLFHSVDDREMLKFAVQLSNKQNEKFRLFRKHWWLAGFCLGTFDIPENLVMDISITFPDYYMMQMFLHGMSEAGYCNNEICVCGHTVNFTFNTPHTRQPRYIRPVRSAYSQWMNKWLCRVFNYVTKPFDCSMEKVLYLYYYIPFVFRRILCCKKQKKWKMGR